MVINVIILFASGELGWLQMVGQYCLAVDLDGYKWYQS